MRKAERSEAGTGEPEPGEWAAGWREHERRQLLAFASATPAQRLAWLEEVLVLAYRAGALPRPREPWGR